MANPIQLQQFAYLLDRNFAKILEGHLRPLETTYQQIYNIETTNRLAEEYGAVGDVPDIPAFPGKVEYLTMNPDFKTRIETREFSGGLLIERRLLDTKQFRVMDNLQNNLARALARTKDKKATNLFNDAFSASWEFMSNDEGVALCGSHSTKAGIPTTTGFSNAGSSAPSKVAIQATRLLMRRFKTDIGEYFACNPDTIICSEDYYDQICEAVGYDPRSGATSSLDPTTANNSINVIYKAFKVIPLPYLDSNKWFMIDSSYAKQFLVWLDRIKEEHYSIVDHETQSIKQIIYSSIGCGWINWRPIYGHVV